MPTYFPQLANAMLAQAGNQGDMRFKTTIQDTESGLRTAWAWFGGALDGYPTSPLYSWKLPYVGLSESERTTLEAYFAARKGRFDAFTFLDPSGNLCASSEDFTAAAWTKDHVTVTTNGSLADPFGGTAASLLTSSGSDGFIESAVLPDGDASGFVLCDSVWVLAAAAISLRIGFRDSSGTELGATNIAIPANTWRRIAKSLALATNNPITMRIGGGSTWASGVALRLFGAQCAPSYGPGGYAKTPGNYGLHGNVRFDSDGLEWTKTDFNQNSVNVSLREFFT